jgi:cobalt-zinc-cadmium efflux system outer membrane protein
VKSRLRGSVALSLVFLAGGCAAHSAHDRDYVSESVRSRTGHSLRPTASEASGLPQGVAVADGVTEEEAVAVALWSNPDLEAALAELGLARADLVEAGLIRNPIFSLLFPLGPKQLEFTLTWPIETLWQRPKRVAAARLDVQRVAERLVQGGLDVVRDARTAHAELRLAEDRARLARESREVRVRVAAITEARLRLGDVSALEAAAARIDGARAEDEAARAERDLESTREKLRALLGLAANAPPLQTTPAEPAGAAVRGLDELLKEAFAARPELRAAELGIEAAGRRIGLAGSEITTLSGVLDANGSGKKGFEMGPGVVIELPLFGRNKGRIARAEAELELESKRYLAVRARIASEVAQARVALLQALESLAAWEERMTPVFEETLARVEKSRDAGEVAELDVLAARRSLLEARLHGADARAAVRRGEAALGRSVGTTGDLTRESQHRSEGRP